MMWARKTSQLIEVEVAVISGMQSIKLILQSLVM